MKLQLKRSVSLDGAAAKAPTASQLGYGELAINYNTVAGPVIFTKNSSNEVIEILPKLSSLIVTNPSIAQTINGKLMSDATVDGDGGTVLVTKGWISGKVTAIENDSVSLSETSTQTLASKLIIDSPVSGDASNTAATKGYVDTTASNLLDKSISTTQSMGGVINFASAQTFDASKLSGTISVDSTGNTATATTLETAINIGGTSFDGSTDINVAELNGLAASHYLDASNINAGTVPTARLTAASKSAAGVVQLSDATASNSETTAPTSKVFAEAYELADEALSKTYVFSQTMNGKINFAAGQEFPVSGIQAGNLANTVVATNVQNGLLIDANINTNAAIAGSKIQAAGANGANAGVVTLTNSITSASTTIAASAAAVKLAAETNPGSTISIQETAPGGASAADIWWDSSDNSGSAYIYYDDGDSEAWVPLVPGAGSIDYTRTVLRDDSTTQTMISKLTTLATASNDSGTTVTTKGYVDTSDALKMDNAGGTFTGNVRFNDDKKLTFGTTPFADLEIQCDGSNSYITNNLNNLYIRNSNLSGDSIYINAANTEPSLQCKADAEVTLFYNGFNKLETTNTGINVTGILAGDTVEVGSFNNISPSSTGAGHVQIKANSYYGYVTCDGTGIYLGNNSSTASLALQTNETDRLFVKANGYIGINTSSPDDLLHLKGGAPWIRLEDTDVANSWCRVSTVDGMSFETHASSVNDQNFTFYAGSSKVLELSGTGALDVTGYLSKGSGSFKIDHPLPSKNNTHNLIHSFIEGPQADLIYRGKATLVNGAATINIDINSGMTEGTFILLNGDVQCFTTNETGWTAVKGEISGNILTLTAQDSECTDNISWMVIGERIDRHMIDAEWTDESGKVLVETVKAAE